MKWKLVLLAIGLSFSNIAVGAVMSKKEVVNLQVKHMDGRPFSINTPYERDGNYTTRFGRKATTGACNGNMTIWSRGVVYADRGFASISL